MSLGAAAITLHRFPRDDEEFGAFLDRLAEGADHVDLVDPASFQERLRERYPRAVVHPQDPLGGYRISGSVWYVYRDGSPLRD